MLRSYRQPPVYCFDIDGVRYSTWSSDDLEIIQRRLFYGNFRKVLNARNDEGFLGPQRVVEKRASSRPPRHSPSKRKPHHAGRSVQHIIEEWPNKVPPSHRYEYSNLNRHNSLDKQRRKHRKTSRTKPPSRLPKTPTPQSTRSRPKHCPIRQRRVVRAPSGWAIAPGRLSNTSAPLTFRETRQNGTKPGSKSSLNRTKGTGVSDEIWKKSETNKYDEFDFLSHSSSSASTHSNRARPMSASPYSSREHAAQLFMSSWSSKELDVGLSDVEMLD